MKRNHNHDSAGPQLLPVLFEFSPPTVITIWVARTSNQWHPTAKSMHPSGNGHWLKETVLAPCTYEYCRVLDDQWILDPWAKDYVPNPFGGRDSILEVAGWPEGARLAEAENLLLKNTNK